MKKFLVSLVILLFAAGIAYATTSSTATPASTSRSNAAIMVDGATITNGLSFIYDNSGKVLLGAGTTVPAAAATGFAKGAIWIDTDIGNGVSGTYENVGTSSAALFKKIGTFATNAAFTTKTLTIANATATNTTGNDATIAGGTLVGVYPSDTAQSVFLNSLAMDSLGNITGKTSGNVSGTATWKITVLAP